MRVFTTIDNTMEQRPEMLASVKAGDVPSTPVRLGGQNAVGDVQEHEGPVRLEARTWS